MSPPLITRLRSSVFAFPLAALAALAMLVISETSFQEATRSFALLNERGQARVAIQTLWRNLNQAETGQRGYLLTGRKEYLTPYIAALPSVQRSLALLQNYYADDATNLATVKRAAKAVDAKLAEMQLTITAHDRGEDAKWREMLQSDVGRASMDEAQALTEELLQRESARIAIERDGVLQTLMINRIGIAAMTALSLLALFMYLRQTVALERAQTTRERLIQDERDRLESDVRARTEQLRELAHHLQTIREDERSHLARELHDELGALLTAAKLDAARLRSRIGTSSPEALERLAHLNEQLNSGIALKRRIIEDLRPSSLSNLGLVAALEILLREFADRSELSVSEQLERVDLDPRAELTVFRLVQEALTNIARYAKATTVRVGLGPHGSDQVLISVRDDGVGFDADKPRPRSHGLLGMRYRVEADGGSMRLESRPGAGTLIEATLPRWRRPDPDEVADDPDEAATVDEKTGHIGSIATTPM